MKRGTEERSFGRTMGGIGLAASALILMFASVAWACTSQAVLAPPGSAPSGSGLDPNFGPPGLFPVRVEGSAFQPGPVSIRWNSLGGPELATASGPDFSVSIRIPEDASTGVSSVIAFQRDSFGNVSALARAPFEVTTSSGTGGGPVPGGSSSGSASGASDTVSSGGRTSIVEEGGDESQPSPGEGAAQGTVGISAGESSSNPIGSQQGVSAPATDPAPQRHGSESLSSITNSPSTRKDQSNRSIVSDLWSGFEDGRLRPSLPETISQEPLPTNLVAGTALLGIGVIALLGGFALAEARRRSVTRTLGNI